MRFAFTEQQMEFRNAVRQLLDRDCTPADLRAVFDAAVDADGESGLGGGAELGLGVGASQGGGAVRTPRWTALADMGVVGLTVPESQGGLGLSELDLVLLLEEAGRAALPEPFLETTALAAPLLARTAARWESGSGSGNGSGSVSGPGAPEASPGSGPLADHWLPLIAAGDAVAAIGVSGMRAIPGAFGADLYI